MFLAAGVTLDSEIEMDSCLVRVDESTASSAPLNPPLVQLTSTTNAQFSNTRTSDIHTSRPLPAVPASSSNTSSTSRFAALASHSSTRTAPPPFVPSCHATDVVPAATASRLPLDGADTVWLQRVDIPPLGSMVERIQPRTGLVTTRIRLIFCRRRTPPRIPCCLDTQP